MITAAELLEVVLETKLEADQGITAGHFSVVSFIVVFLQDRIDNSGSLSDLFSDPNRAKLLSPALFGIALIILMPRATLGVETISTHRL